MGRMRALATSLPLAPRTAWWFSPGSLVVAFTLLRLALAATAPLLPQEAYYWT